MKCRNVVFSAIVDAVIHLKIFWVKTCDRVPKNCIHMDINANKTWDLKKKLNGGFVAWSSTTKLYFTVIVRTF